jgi:3-methyl-2-oxobutanoate hydroxymethyltransferase
MMSAYSETPKITTHVLQNMKKDGEKITMLTSYDYSMARILENSGIDVILVGDSASNVMAGHETTIPITLDEMIYHAKCVVKAVKRSLVIVDLPFGTYQGDSKEALNSAIRIMKETGAGGIKIEGGNEIQESVSRILSAGIPVMGHLGLIPQSIHKFGTFKVRATSEKEAEELIDNVELLERLGCFGIVLEKIPAELAAKAARKVNIPVIGIGAGADVDGQVLVLHDMLGITKDFSPRFLRRYHNLYDEIQSAVKDYINDVRSNDFPNENEQY